MKSGDLVRFVQIRGDEQPLETSMGSLDSHIFRFDVRMEYCYERQID